MFQSSVVQASQHSWTGIHHHRTIIENHDNYNGVSDTSTYINYNLSLLRLLTLRAGDILSDDDDSTSNNSRRRRKRKRVRLDPPPLSTDVENGGEQLDVNDDAVVVSKQLQLDSDEGPDTEPVINKEKRKRRRLFQRSKKEDDVDSSIEEGVDHQEDVVATSSNDEAEKRIKKRRRKKVVGETSNEVETDVGVDDSIPEMVGGVADEDGDTHSSPEDGNELHNTEITQTTKRTKKRKRKKKRDTSTIVQDTVDDTIVGEETPEAIDAKPLPLMEKLVESPNEGVSRTKKRKRKKRGTNTTIPDSVDVDKEEETPEVLDASQESSIEIPSEEMNETPKKRRRRRRGTNKSVQEDSDDVINEGEETPEAIDTSLQPSINASVDIHTEEIVPESIGSSIEVDDSLNILPMVDEEFEELPSEEMDDSVEKEIEPVSDGEYTSEPTEEVLAEAENEEVEEMPSENEVDRVGEELEPASDDEKSIPIIDAAADNESDGDYALESTEEVPTEAKNEKVRELPSEKAVDSTEKETEPAPDDESITIIDASDDMESDKVPAEAGNEEVEELPSQDAEPADDDNDDEVEHLVIDASNEIPGEELVSESFDASIGIEEDFRAERFEDADGGSDDMDVIVNNVEEKEENDEEMLQESNAAISSDEGESETPTLPSEGSVACVEDNPVSVEDVTVDDTCDKSTGDDIGSGENEEKEEIEQSNSPEVGEISIQSNDQHIEQENHESEREGVVSQEEPREEECSLIDKYPTAHLEQSNSDVGVNTEEETSIDQNSIELEKMEDDCLTVSVVTWNLAEASFSEQEASFFNMFRKGDSKIGSDLVLIGAQECEDIKPRRSEGHRSRHLRRVGIQMLGKDYVPLAIHSLGGIQMALYCHRDVLGDVEMVNIADVTCGVGNVFHNKGAIGVYLKMKRISGQKNEVAKTSRILFVTGHLAAHVKNVGARNDDFKRIISGLEAQAPVRFLRPKRNPDGSPSECDGSYLLKSMDHVFFAGDLNYRVDLPREFVERCIIDIKENQSGGRLEEVDILMNKLLRRDQLLQTIASGRAFPNFSEAKVTFLPTFKFDKGTQNYDTSHKQRVPAWTDRILFRSSKVNVLEYQSVPAAMHSDHRPVFGTYQLGWGITTTEKRIGGKRGKRNRKK